MDISRHYLFEFEGCSLQRVNSPAWISSALKRLCKRAPLNPVRRLQHEFSPHGLTAFLILKESHLALSTWPEYRYACLNILLCGKCPGLSAAVNDFAEGLKAKLVRRRAWTLQSRQP